MKRNFNRIVIAHLNINSIKNRSELLVCQIVGKVDVLVISETTLNNSYPSGTFKFPVFLTPFTRDHNRVVGGLLWWTVFGRFFVRKYIPTKYSSKEIVPVEGIYIESNLCMKSWLLCCSYNNNVNIMENHLDVPKRCLDMYFAKYENFMIIGDLNVEVNLDCMNCFLKLMTETAIRLRKSLHALTFY